MYRYIHRVVVPLLRPSFVDDQPSAMPVHVGTAVLVTGDTYEKKAKLLAVGRGPCRPWFDPLEHGMPWKQGAERLRRGRARG